MPKQAVLLIHGVGDQRPMDSLRRFVHSVWTTDAERQRAHGARPDGLWSKPYDLGEDFELRGWATAENEAGIRTDFFEFYWAHLMHGTTLSHLVTWGWTLLWRNPFTSVPRSLRLAYWTLVVLAIAAVVFVYRAKLALAGQS